MRAPSHYNPQNGNIYCYPQAVHSGMRYRPEPPIHMGGEKRNGPATEFEWRCAEPATVAAIVLAMNE